VRQSGAGILTLLLVWVILFVAVPALSTPLAHMIVDPPAVEVGQAAMIGKDYEVADELQKRIDEAFARRFGDKKPKDLSREEQFEWYQETYAMRQDRTFAVVDRINGEGQKLTRTQASIDNLARTMSRASPFGCLQNICVALAGTDFQRVVDLRTSIEKYYYGVCKNFVDFTKNNDDISLFPVASVPLFHLERTAVGGAVERCLFDWAVLALMGVVAALVAYTSFLRMEIL
jgi:hypothetical protein